MASPKTAVRCMTTSHTKTRNPPNPLGHNELFSAGTSRRCGSAPSLVRGIVESAL